MRVDAWNADRSRCVTLRCAHDDLEDCVGQATAAFGLELLRGRGEPGPAGATVPPGVWYPAELGEAARTNILRVVREKATVWEM